MINLKWICIHIPCRCALCVCVDVAHVLCPQIPRNTWKCVCTVKAACTHARTGIGLVNAWKCDGSREGKPTTQASVTEARPGIPPRWNWKSWLKVVFVYLHLHLCICICICVFTFVFEFVFVCLFMYLKAKPQHEDQSQKPDRAFLLDVARQILVLSNVLSNKTIFVGTFCKFSSCQCGNFLSNLTIFVFASTIAQWLMGDGRITWNRILEVGEMWGACISSCLKSNRLVSYQWRYCGIDLIWCEVFGGTVT